jgi:predicted RNA binding protein YcfA (HicA-like mRNA interferase family)
VSPALSDLPVRKITRVLESLGFVYVRTKGSHAVFRHPDGRAVVVPQHGTVKRGTLGQFCGKPVSRLPSSSNCFIDAQLSKRDGSTWSQPSVLKLLGLVKAVARLGSTRAGQMQQPHKRRSPANALTGAFQLAASGSRGI